MATIIEQAPKSQILPVGQPIIFTVSNDLIVATELNVKFVALVYVSSGLPPSTNAASTQLVGTFKTTPNNKGVGMFDFRPLLESYVKSDSLARGATNISTGSSYKGVQNFNSSPRILHLIDNYSGNNNLLKRVTIKFKTEYLDKNEYLANGVTPNPNYNTLIQVQQVLSHWHRIFNGYLKNTDVLLQRANGVDFGYSLEGFRLSNTSKSFLTNAPTTQYANIEDYGVVSLLMLEKIYSGALNPDGFYKLYFKYYDASGLLDEESMFATPGTGANAYADRDFAFYQVLYAGIYPANLRGWSTKFRALVTAGTIQGGYYTVQAREADDSLNSQLYTINVNCPTLKGYEPIRLTWLNQWGVWDYYTFTMKSTRMLSTKGSTYQQLAGSWNDSAYRLDSFRGGKKAFRVNATEKITMNTDFVNESESAWFEELINSPEVYILEGYQDDIDDSALNQYVTPARLTTSSYTRKTVANDKLMQYTFEVEKSKTLRTQSI
mgnify:CR=1 FL=1